jgi:glycosyltransferase involved in cell wall biosynthesis
LIVRYHDAVPLLQPHTTRRRVFDSVAHGLALQRNVSDRAWFACVSESSRQALLALYPAIGGRAATVHNMLCAAYDEEPRGADEVLGVLQRNAGNRGHRATSGSPGPMAPYLLMVATLEPRKNHATLLDAWLHLRQTGAPTLQLVLVGSRGWRFESILQRLEVHLLSGAAHLLEGVPAEDLRLLYRHAVATVCPSLAEGFGYAGAEAMNCGGVVVASDLPVHREIYGDAAIYYAPNTAAALKDTVAKLLDPAAAQSRESRKGMGRALAARYMKKGLLAVWSELLLRVCKGKFKAAKTS